jgi:hypothetical protein
MEIIVERTIGRHDSKLGHLEMQMFRHISSLLLFLQIKWKNLEETEDKEIRVSPSRRGRMCARIMSGGNILKSFMMMEEEEQIF